MLYTLYYSLGLLQIWKGGTASTWKLSVPFCCTHYPDKFLRRVQTLCYLGQIFHVVHINTLERLPQNCETVLTELFYKGKELKIEDEKRGNNIQPLFTPLSCQDSENYLTCSNIVHFNVLVGKGRNFNYACEQQRIPLK